jgi:hypothetical protein
MNQPYKTMQSFSKRLRSVGGSFNFYFNPLPDKFDARYHVSFVDKDNRARSFIMLKYGDHWSLQDPGQCPEAIRHLEYQLQAALEHPYTDN